MAKSKYHVVPHAERGWAIKKEGAERVSTYSSTQRGAEKVAKRLVSSSGGGEIVIHRRDGKIRDSDTIHPAHDPFPPRDKKH